MNLRDYISKRSGPRGEGAFTMVEIAIALAVIAFALVAIIGILPIGLQAQRDNREDTLVNQDARVLIEAIKSGGRNVRSDLGSYVVYVDSNGTDYSQNNPPGIETTNLIQLLSDTNVSHRIVMSSISGAIATRGTDLGLRYEIINTVAPSRDFANTPLADQVFEVRLRFAWPVRPVSVPPFVNSEANTYKARTLISGWRTNDVIYAQYYYQPLTNWSYLTNWP